jgi:hypothetical protein
MGSLWDLLKLGTAELVAKALAGELSAGTLWTAIRGAERYRAAMAAGDVASETEAQRRAQVCANCPSRTSRQVAALGADAHYCGPAFEDRTAETPPTCGCLISVTVGGKAAPAGKAMVNSERCPQGIW